MRGDPIHNVSTASDAQISEPALGIVGLYVDQQSLLAACPWLSVKRLGTWKRDGLPYFVGKDGVSVYRIKDLENRIKGECKAWDRKDSNTVVDGSQKRPEVKCGTKTGTSIRLEELAADHLAQQI